MKLTKHTRRLSSRSRLLGSVLHEVYDRRQENHISLHAAELAFDVLEGPPGPLATVGPLKSQKPKPRKPALGPGIQNREI
jgi:hypothetical protein